VLKIYQEIKLAFIVSGHTNFPPDGHFGKIKEKVKETEVYWILLAKMAESENQH